MIIKPAKILRGTITVPGDKSISHRSLILGAIALGDTRVKGLLECDDCRYTSRALRAMGVGITQKKGITTIRGVGLHGLKKPRGVVFAGESGTTMRLLAGLLAGQDFPSAIDGSLGLRHRPMGRVARPLSLMGARIDMAEGGFPPLKIRPGPLNGIYYKSPVASAQVKSAVLLAGLYADGKTVFCEMHKSRDHTERMLKYLGADIKVNGREVSIKGGRELRAGPVDVPGDISSAAFFIVAATLLPGSRVVIKNISINPTRTGILNVMARMGARISVQKKTAGFEPAADIRVRSGAVKGTVIRSSEIPSMIDELPAIFVLAAHAKGRTVIRGAGELRVKETDRIDSMMRNLVRMGADVYVESDQIVIEGRSGLCGADLAAFGDHRTCMAGVVAALAAKGVSRIDDTRCVSKSFPGFFDALNRVAR
jgi:3-phosphoshikimate 1-carboxyvinyltransferase